MALVAYSDESDFSDSNEDTSLSKSEIRTEKINAGSDESLQDIDLNCKQKKNGTIQISSLNDETAEFKPSHNFTVDTTLNSSELMEETDVVDDVPTVQNWNIINSKESTNHVFKKKEPKSKKLKLVLPALSEFDDDEEEEEIKDKSLKKKIQPSNRGTGLFAVLPKPRSATSLIPLNVSRKKVPIPEKRKKPQQKPNLPKCFSTPVVANDSDEEFISNSETNDFFSLTKPDSPPSLHSISEPELNINSPANIPTPLQKPAFKPFSLPTTTEEKSYTVPSTYDPADDPPLMNNPQPSEIDIQALRRLGGRRGNKDEIPNIIDIKADDALMSREEWVTRALCDEKPKRSFSKKREGNPTQQQKRKHQITYLAHQAQEREQDLQTSWGQNRFTKMQTQSRYGF